MADFSDIKKAIKKYGDALVARAQRNLKVTRRRKKAKGSYSGNATATGNLSKSIGFDSDVNDKGIATISVSMLEYGIVLNNGRGKTKGGGSGTPLKESIQEWLVDKKIRPRNEKGEFTRGPFKRSEIGKSNDLKGMAFAIARSIHRRGYDAAPFFDEALEQSKKEQNEVSEVYLGSFDDVIEDMIQEAFIGKKFKTE